MDRVIKNKSSRFKKGIPHITVILLVIVALIYYLSTDIGTIHIDRDDVRIGVVQLGAFNVKILGTGKVVPSDIEYVLPKSAGTVVKVFVESGDAVRVGQHLFQFTNEELQSQLSAKALELSEYKATLSSKNFDLYAQEISLESDATRLESEYLVAQEKHNAMLKLIENEKLSPISQLEFQEAKIRANQLRKQWQLSMQRLHNFLDSKETQLEQYRARLAVAEEMRTRLQEKVDALILVAHKSGIIQEVSLKPGQRVEVGTVLAKIVKPDDILIRLKVPASQSDKLQINQQAVIKSSGHEIDGYITRIDPNVTGATLEVDIMLHEKAGFLKTSMHVSGEISVLQLDQVKYVETPSNVVENGSSQIYVLNKSGNKANLRRISIGALSSRHVQIIDGLDVGDKVILSDLSKTRGAETVILN